MFKTPWGAKILLLKQKHNENEEEKIVKNNVSTYDLPIYSMTEVKVLFLLGLNYVLFFLVVCTENTHF